MPSSWDDDFDTWIWVPFGFAHGNLYLEESTIEYFATATWNPSSEVGINPLSKDIDWSLVDKEILDIFKNNQEKFIISEKDKGGATLKDWLNDERIKFIR
jgi:dTDP-4-dehydrorhamnose 3,5-epimerase-like enzyme